VGSRKGKFFFKGKHRPTGCSYRGREVSNSRKEGKKGREERVRTQKSSVRGRISNANILRVKEKGGGKKRPNLFFSVGTVRAGGGEGMKKTSFFKIIWGNPGKEKGGGWGNSRKSKKRKWKSTKWRL